MRDSGQLEGPLAAADLAPLLHPVTHPSRLSPCVTQALGEGAADSETPLQAVGAENRVLGA